MNKMRYSVKDKHDYYNSIYQTLHPNYDPETRVYTKNCENFNFIFKDNNLVYSRDNELDVNAAKTLFKGISDEDIDFSKQPIHSKISYYLTNRLVPVYQ